MKGDEMNRMTMLALALSVGACTADEVDRGGSAVGVGGEGATEAPGGEGGEPADGGVCHHYGGGIVECTPPEDLGPPLDAGDPYAS